MTASLAERHIPVVSYGVGPRVDRQILGILAEHTGGMVLDEPQGGAADAGRQLAAAAAATVVWPTAAVKWPAEVGEVIPKTLPPLRSDRDTVLIGTLKGKEPLRIEAGVDAPGGVKTLSWTAVPGKSVDDNNYLPALVEPARTDGGLTMPLVGSASLTEARQQIQAGGRTMNQLARQAVAWGTSTGPSGWRTRRCGVIRVIRNRWRSRRGGQSGQAGGVKARRLRRRRFPASRLAPPMV